jgi:hypothetical protein
MRFILLLCLLWNISAHAGRQIEIPTPKSEPMPLIGLSKPLSSQFELAVISAQANTPWTLVGKEPGRMLMQLQQKRHRLLVAVEYDANSYRIRYMDSDNLNYHEEDGQAYIHPRYLDWVRQLRLEINAQIIAQAAADEAQPE